MTPVGFSERPFDASILGRPVWCLDDVAQAKNAVTDAQRESIGLMFRRGDASEGGILEPLGFRKIETLITLGCALPGQKQRLPTGIGIAQATDADAIADLAARAFRSDRWHSDPEIPDDRADAYKAACGCHAGYPECCWGNHGVQRLVVSRRCAGCRPDRRCTGSSGTWKWQPSRYSRNRIWGRAL